MKKRSAIVVAGMLVSALLAGMVSRQVTLGHAGSAALKPSAVVIQQQPPAPAASSFQGEPGDSVD